MVGTVGIVPVTGIVGGRQSVEKDISSIAMYETYFSLEFRSLVIDPVKI